MLRLHDLSYRRGQLEYRVRRLTEPEWALEGYLSEAKRLLAEAGGGAGAAEAQPQDPTLDPHFERLRWFPMPGEAAAELGGGAGVRCNALRGCFTAV